MDPQPNQVNSRGRNYPSQSAAGASGEEPQARHMDGQTPAVGRQPAADRQPQYSGAFTVIPPNQTRRSKNKEMAQRETEELQRYKEAHRPGPLHLAPERLGGGDVTIAEARQRQFTNQRGSSLQKKLKKEDMDKRKRQEEEEEWQKMKATQREKAERLELKRRQEDQRRRELFHSDQTRKNDSFLQNLERAAAPSGGAAHTSTMNKVSDQEAGKLTRSMEELQLEHKRVNQAFLDKLECNARGTEVEASSCSSREEERPRLTPDDHRRHAAAGRVALTHPEPGPERRCSDWTEETDPQADRDWNLMKLVNIFPDCSRDFVQDILTQCNGDYEQACALLVSTLT
ncbi:epithelial-stromal interaction protein 1 isoform X1 [Poecilia latipinna]|uniref:epithelial-stromal interaction protein 1 isoform X1 n=1 Tax=Poecilia latipinna TaxID=48699 RepID=UPI00072E7D97|nr:PREDICTED: epithelial-stromal interaction protein 1 isoform X1 [Poecilia latipinna]